MSRGKRKTARSSSPARSPAITPSREIALDVLEAVSNGRFAEHALSDRLDEENLIPEDRGLATELIYGILRWRHRLDAIIDRCLERPRRKLKPPLREILRIALYQIIFLDRIPNHATVDQAVKQARIHCGIHTAGFVNAVLRNALRNKTAVDPPPQDDPASLAVYYSHPLWLVQRWIKQFGHETTVRILIANNSRAPVDLRVNRLKATPESVLKLFRNHGTAAQPISYMPDALVLSAVGGPIYSLPGYEDGLFVVQARASQLIAPMLGVRPGERILDACAAPGGKTSQLAALALNQVQIVAMDADEDRLHETHKNLQRLGVTCVQLVRGDARDAGFVKALGGFDRVLLDAPCSNLGVLRHNPEVKYRLNFEAPEAFARDQLQMLNATASALRPGGVLVYSVCTVSEEETTGVVKRFLQERPGYVAIAIDPGEVPLEEFVDAQGFFSTFPPPMGEPLDGFFAARIQRL